MAGRRASNNNLLVRLDERFHTYIMGPDGLLERQKVTEKQLIEISDAVKQIAVVIPEFYTVKKAVLGDANTDNENARRGLEVRFDDHESAHRKLVAGLVALVTLVVTALSSVLHDFLRKLGWL